jgi:hypothetical protein
MYEIWLKIEEWEGNANSWTSNIQLSLQKCWNKKHIHRLEEVEAEEEAAGKEEIPENAQVGLGFIWNH